MKITFLSLSLAALLLFRSFVNLYFGKDGYIQVCLRQMSEDGDTENPYNPLWLNK